MFSMLTKKMESIILIATNVSTSLKIVIIVMMKELNAENAEMDSMRQMKENVLLILVLNEML